MEGQLHCSKSLVKTSSVASASRNEVGIREHVEGDRSRMPHGHEAEFERHMEDISRNIGQVETYTPLLLSQKVCSTSTAQVIQNAIGLFFACLAVTANLLDQGVEEIEYHDSSRATCEPTGAPMSMYITHVQELQASVCQLGRFRLDRPGAKQDLQQLIEYFKEKIRALISFLDASRQNVASSVASELHYVPNQSKRKQKKGCVFGRPTFRVKRLRRSPFHVTNPYRRSKSMKRTKKNTGQILLIKQQYQRILNILPMNGLMPHVNNSCWLNAILGALYYALGAPLFLLQTWNLDGLSPLAREILNILIRSRSVRVDETYVDHLLRLVASQFNWEHGDQQDACEFIMRILKTDLQQPLTQIQASSEYKVKAQCRNCKQEKTFEFYWVKVLDLECSKDLHVHIDRFLEQQLSQLKCNHCQADFNISTQGNLSIISYPDLLVIHLSRGQKNFKSTSPIKIENYLQLQQRQYSLKAVVVHRGNGNKCEPSHFVTYFILPDCLVYLYDDCVDGYEIVPFYSFKQEAERNAIVLFYK